MTDFYDKLKSVTSGYASFDYEPAPNREADLVMVDILLNAKPVPELSFVCHRSKCQYQGRRVCEKLRANIDRQQYEVIIQAAIGNKVFAAALVDCPQLNWIGSVVTGCERNVMLECRYSPRSGLRRTAKMC